MYTLSMKQELIESFAEKLNVGCRNGFFRRSDSSTTNPWTFFDNDRSHELVLSKALAWIMNPIEGHGVDEFFLNKMLKLVSSKENKAQLPINPERTVVAVESQNLDVLVESEPVDAGEPTSVVVVENKHLAGETRRASDNVSQLVHYPEKVRIRYKDRNVRVKFIYLTPDGRPPEDDLDERANVWVPVSYSDIVAILDDAVKIAPNDAARKAISDFSEHLKDILLRHTSEARSYVRNSFLKLSDSKTIGHNDFLSIFFALVKHLEIATADERARLVEVLRDGRTGNYGNIYPVSDPKALWNQLALAVNEESSMLANEQRLHEALAHAWDVLLDLINTGLDFRFERSVQSRLNSKNLTSDAAKQLLVLGADLFSMEFGRSKIRIGFQSDKSWTVQLYDANTNEKIGRIGRIVGKNDYLQIHFQDSARFHRTIFPKIQENIDFFETRGICNNYAIHPTGTGLLNATVKSAELDSDCRQHVVQTFRKIADIRVKAAK